MDPRDWLLLFVAAGNGRPVDPVRLQKGLFLLAMECDLPHDQRYAFEPYAYGPMSRDLYRDVRALRDTGALTAVPVAGVSWSAYVATPDGDTRARTLCAGAPRRALLAVARIRERLDALTFADVLEDVYARYPAFAARSVFVRR